MEMQQYAQKHVNERWNIAKQISYVIAALVKGIKESHVQAVDGVVKMDAKNCIGCYTSMIAILGLRY